MSSNKRKITILGVTGSIGQSTADVILANQDAFEVHAVTAGSNVEALAAAAIRLKACKAIIADESLTGQLEELLLDHQIHVEGGAGAITNAAGERVDLVMAAIMGFAGLRPILNAIENGNNVAVANKEPIVAAGREIMELAKQKSVKILPVDSEHNAIFQIFENHNKASIERIVLTASGGPFLNWTLGEMGNATPEQAVTHPNWSMGKKISVDSASMMNKALEIIEAHYLFGMPVDKIDVVVHPQSIIHSMVEYNDGSFLAQLGASDMRTPIAYALGWPERINSAGKKLDLTALSTLTFQQPDFDRFPALSYAYKCLKLGQGACVVMNAANEIAVAKFLNNEIGFGDIMSCVAYAVDDLYPKMDQKKLKTVEEIVELDNIVREAVTLFANDLTASQSKERA